MWNFLSQFLPCLTTYAVLVSQFDLTKQLSGTDCYGNARKFHDVVCNNAERYLIKELDFGVKNITNSADNVTCSHDISSVCCSYSEDDCVFPMEKFEFRYDYLREFSGSTFRSSSINTPRDRIPPKCGPVTEFSHYVMITYGCIQDSELVDMCSPVEKTSSSYINIYTARNTQKDLDFCQCSIQAMGSNSSLTVYSVDIRLQERDNRYGNCTDNNNSFTISDSQRNTSLECKEGQSWGPFEELFTTTEGRLNISLLQDITNGTHSQMIWIRINSTSDLHVVCNRRLFTTAPPTSTPSSTKGASSTANRMQTSKVVNIKSNKGRTTLSPEKKLIVHSNRLHVMTYILVTAILVLFALVVITAIVYVRRKKRKYRPPQSYRKRQLIPNKRVVDGNFSLERLQKS